MPSASLYGTNLPPREPEQVCESCGTVGTVGRAVRFVIEDNPEIHRFCRACWPEQRARYRARWEEEERIATEAFFRNPQPGGRSGPSVAFEAATWHNALDWLAMLRPAMHPTSPPSPADLAAIAAEFRASAARIDEPMPFEVEVFVRMHGTPLANEEL
jgi:hypothetical protein